MVFGNSFTQNYFEESGFYEKFSEAYLLHNSNLPIMRDLLSPGLKFLVYQFIELEIGEFSRPDHWPVLP
jgi:hypothetical protein